MGKQIRWTVNYRAQQKAAACTPELAAMLACFATTGDLRSTGEGSSGCATAARNLHACMKKKGKTVKVQRSSINFQLSKVK